MKSYILILCAFVALITPACGQVKKPVDLQVDSKTGKIINSLGNPAVAPDSGGLVIFRNANGIKVMRVFETDTERLAASPDFVGQFCFVTINKGIWSGEEIGTGGFYGNEFSFYGQLNARGMLQVGYYDGATMLGQEGRITLQTQDLMGVATIKPPTTGSPYFQWPDNGGDIGTPAILLSNKDIIKGSITLDFPNITDGGLAELSFNINGAAIGDVVVVTGPELPNGGYLKSLVKTTDYITIQLENRQGFDWNPASATYKWVLFK